MTDPHATKEQDHQKCLLEQLRNVLQAVKQDLPFYTFFFLNIYDQLFAAFYARVILNPIYGMFPQLHGRLSTKDTNIYVRQKVAKGQIEVQHLLLKSQLVPDAEISYSTILPTVSSICSEYSVAVGGGQGKREAAHVLTGLFCVFQDGNHLSL